MRLTSRVFAVWMLAAALPLGFARAENCGPRLAGLPAARIEKMVNAHRLSKSDNRLLRVLNTLKLHKPMRVTERATLLDNGSLPALAKVNQLILIRKSRAEGLEELRAAVDLAEERAFHWVPALEAWVYASVMKSSMDGTSIDFDLIEALTGAFGRIEFFHTHPWNDMKANASMIKDLEPRGDSKGLVTLLLHGRPSQPDLDALKRYLKYWATSPALPFDSYVVHPWGLTYFAIKPSVIKRTGLADLVLYPPPVYWNDEMFEIEKRFVKTEDKLRALLAYTVARNLDHARTFAYRNVQGEMPELVMHFQSWSEIDADREALSSVSYSRPAAP